MGNVERVEVTKDPGVPTTHHSCAEPVNLLMGTSYLMTPLLCSWLTAHILVLFQRTALGPASPCTAELECLGSDTHIPGHHQPIYYHRKAQLLALKWHKLRGEIYIPVFPGIRTWPRPNACLLGFGSLLFLLLLYWFLPELSL